MSKTLKEIYDNLKKSWALSPNNLFYSTVHYDFMDYYNNNTFDARKIDKMIVTKYGSREFDLDLFTTSDTQIYQNFNELFTTFLITNGNNLQRTFEAIETEYNPLYNYDKHSTITTEKSGEETTTLVNDDRNETTTNSVNAFDGVSESEVSKQNHTSDVTTDSNTISFNNRIDTITEETYGNIGVTTNEQMLKDFLNTRPYIAFYDNLFSRFIMEYSW